MQCYNISVTSQLTREEAEKLLWLLAETYEPERLTAESALDAGSVIVEVGPRLNFSTAWSANAVSICESCGISKVKRIEQSRR
jgi:phosphoribosylformylglycinamidine synthase